MFCVGGGVVLVELTGADVVRHALVKRVIQAFEAEESRGNEGGMGPSTGGAAQEVAPR